MKHLVVLAMLITGCAKPPAVPSTPPAPRQLSQAATESLYAAVLESQLARIAPEKTLVVIRQTTHLCEPPRSLDFGCMPSGVAARVESELPLFGAEAIREFAAENRESRLLPLQSHPRTTFVESREIQDMIENGWWEDPFHAKFPTAEGFVQLSSAGISKGQIALIYVGYTCGGLCGSGSLVTMSRTSSGWILLSRKQLWVS